MLLYASMVIVKLSDLSFKTVRNQQVKFDLWYHETRDILYISSCCLSQCFVDWFNLYSVSFQVKVLYVKGFLPDVTEDQIKEVFSPYGTLERVRKVKDYAFVHFSEREHALKVSHMFFLRHCLYQSWWPCWLTCVMSFEKNWKIIPTVVSFQ